MISDRSSKHARIALSVYNGATSLRSPSLLKGEQKPGNDNDDVEYLPPISNAATADASATFAASIAGFIKSSASP